MTTPSTTTTTRPRRERPKVIRLTDAAAERIKEQHAAARLGQYSFIAQLGYESKEVRGADKTAPVDDLLALLQAARPEVVYLHNPADKHDTHVAVLLRCLEALRALPADRRPRRVLGCEVWRDLDWMVDTDKVALDAGRHPELALELLKVFDSQVTGGKRYDLATMGRRSAHATYHTSHATDKVTGITWAMDLTPLLSDPHHQMLLAYGAWGEKSLYGRKFEGILRTTVLIGRDGRVAKIWRSVKVDGHAEQVLAAARTI